MRSTHIGILFIIILLSNSAWARQEVSLNGEWEIQYSQDKDSLPGGEWTKITVPSHVSEQEKQYVWYRRNVFVPESMSGQKIFLKFVGVKFTSEVYMNGQPAGSHYGGWEPFEMEVTNICEAGQENQLLVKASDMRGITDQAIDYSKRGESGRLIDQARDSIMAPVGSRPDQFGIWQDVSLESRSDVYIDDVFVKTSVRNKTIEVDFILVNLSEIGRKGVLKSQVYDEDGMQLEIEAVPVDLPPRSSIKVTLKKEWPSPRLWWPDSPHLYRLVSRIEENGNQMDEVSTRFGFREFWTEGIYFVLNGTRIKFLATAGHPDYGWAKEDAKRLYSDIRGANCVAMRLHANLWPETWYEAADEVGMLLIQESALWCFAQEYALSKDKFWDNMKDHLSGMIRRDKNHPSVVMYSIENEILHVGGNRVPNTEEKLAELGRFVKSIDPTRPIMYDGDADPMGVADVENLHYPHEFPQWNLWPNTAYWVDEKTNISGWPYREWQWSRKKPLYMGEFLWIPTQTPDPYTVFLGDDAYPDQWAARAKAKAVAWSMQIEAFRAAEVSGMCPWTLLEAGKPPNVQYDAIKKAYEPYAAFIKEYDSRFYSRERVMRTAYLYNDTLQPAKLKLIWALKDDKNKVDSGEQEFELEPGDRVSTGIELKIPDVSERKPLSLSLQVKNGEKVSFQDEKQYWAFPKKALKTPKNARIAVYAGIVPAQLKDIKYTRLKGFSEIPKGIQLLIVGPHALDSMESKSDMPVAGDDSSPGARLAEFVRDGGTVLVMQQSAYPGGLLPASLTPHSSTIAFRRMPEHEILKGIGDDDLKMWRGDHIVSENDISKPTGGCFRAIIDSGGEDGLTYLPLVEIFSGQGRYILCQLSLFREYAEPIAHIIFQNIIDYALKPPSGRVKAGIVNHQLNIKRAVESVGVICDDLSDKLGEEPLKNYGVLIIEGGAPEVSANVSKIREFAQSGGKVLIHGLMPGDMERLNGLFPEKISLSRSISVPVTIFQQDPVISGMANHDLYWLGPSTGPWDSPAPLLPEIIEYVVARELPEPEKCQVIEAENMAVEEGDIIANQGNAIYMYAAATIASDIDFPSSAEYIFGVSASGTPFQGIYPEVTLFVDGARRASVTLEAYDWKVYTMTTQVNAGKHRIALAFTNDKYDPVTKEDRNLTLDKLIYAEGQPTVVKQLLTPPALAKVPMGRGFYLIDQINWHDRATSLDKASRYLTNLMMNLGVPFSEEAEALSISGAQMKPAEDLMLYSVSGQIARLAANGYIFSDVRFVSDREYLFEISAKGTEAGGEYPNIRLKIDDQVISEQMLQYSGWEILTFKTFVAAGVHRISLEFTNDYWEPPADRNLEISRLRVK